MENSEKLAMIRAMMPDAADELDSTLTAYLTAAEKEIIAWRWGNSEEPPTEVPWQYDMTQVQAVIAGYTHRGAEGQMTHSENGYNVTFKYDDMIMYIRSHVIPICKVV